MMITPIRNEKDYKRTIKRIEEIWDTKDKKLRDELDVISTLVDLYEETHFNILPPDPIEAIKFRMEQMGLKKTDISPLLGGNNRVSEILSRKRALTVEMIRNLNKKLNIPAESLISQQSTHCVQQVLRAARATTSLGRVL
jgi:HTH-type transcriptional regulator/antitoxin HigA